LNYTVAILRLSNIQLIVIFWLSVDKLLFDGKCDSGPILQMTCE